MPRPFQTLPLLLALASLPAPAASPPEVLDPPAREDRLILTVPLLSVESYTASRLPGWEQAVAINTSAVLFAHDAVWRATRNIDQPLLRGLAFGVGSVLSDFLVWLAIDPAWAHEEGHRSVLALYSLPGLNGAIDPPGSWPDSYRPVYGLADAQLAFLKERHNPDMIRLQAAGYESELLGKLALERATFWADRPGGQNILQAAYTHLSVISYFTLCLDQRLSDRLLQDEVDWVGTDVFHRDFTGPDCGGWVYDLHRPDEPYAARGPHPSGVGIRRDRLPSDMSSAELSYLRRQRNLLLLNLVDPHQFGFASFRGTNPFTHRPFRWNAQLAHLPTSFGSSTEARVLLAEAQWKLGLTLHGFLNGQAFFPGLTAELFRYPIRPFDHPLDVSATVSLWLQPRAQRFDTAEPSPGAMASLTLSQRVVDAVDLDLRLRGKTAGWVALQPSLAPAVDVTLSASLLLP
ncbi:MAG TPA: hypothetical protein VK447_04750 [Myxococcaceae bacterium]|nr:hypothetical protein [Myxococcaceae bacterium]